MLSSYCRGGRGFVARHLLQQFGLRVASKRPATGQQLVEHHAQAEDVAAAIDPMPFATGLFGTHVGGRPGILRSLADVLFSQCQPEIDDVRLAVLADQNVARLDVPMHQSLLVGVVQGLGHRRHQFGRFPVLQPLLLELRREIGPFDVLRDDEAGTVLRAADIMHRHDAGMVEIGDRAGLGQIRLGIFGLRDQLGVRHLDGDRPVQLLVVGQIDQAEAAFAQDLLDAVATDPLRAPGRIPPSGGIGFPRVLRHIVGIRVVQIVIRSVPKRRSRAMSWDEL